MILSLGICCIVAIVLLILAKNMERKESKADTFDGGKASEVENAVSSHGGSEADFLLEENIFTQQTC